jgi:nucleoside-diphosphate-sugar epimerase
MILSPNEHYSINHIVQILESIVLKEIHEYNYDKSKPNGQKKKNTNNMKFRNFCEKYNFELTPLRQGLEQTINYFTDKFENNPNELKL